MQDRERTAAGGTWQGTNLVFCHEDGSVYTSGALNWRFSATTRKAGIGHWHAHEGRHTAVSIMSREGGVPIQEISDTVGHKSTHVTGTVYRHVIVPAIQGGDELTGPLVVGCFVTLAPTVLPLLLAEFGQLNPQVTVDFVEGNQDQFKDALPGGEIDTAVMYDMGHLQDLDRIVVYQARAVPLVGRGHPLAGHPTVTLEQLVSDSLILFDQPPSTDYAMSLFNARGLVPNVRHRTHAYELTRSIVACSIGYAILVQRPPNELSYECLPS
jgi:hypothetical protein